MDTIDIPLSSLKRDPANPRKIDLAPLESFLASVREHGILEPLTVRKDGAHYLVTNGGKRLAALGVLLKDKKIAADMPVPCIVREVSEADARDVGLALNVMREAMHPVDEYEAFTKLIEDGVTEEDIRKRYGLTARELAQSLALGRLSPVIRKAWAAGEMLEEVARAFTLEPDQERQEAIFKRNFGKGKGGANAFMIRQAIVGDWRTAGAMLRYVGLEAYRDAGGATAEDLFSDEKGASPMATDQALLKKLFDKKVADKVQDLKAEGWKWVEHMSDLPSGAYYWPSTAKTKIKADDRKNYGVIVNVSRYSAEVEIKYGVQKPSPAKKAKAATKADGTLEVAMSAALCSKLSAQITEAAAAVIRNDPKLALAVAAASFLAIGGPSDIRSNNFVVDDDEDGEFDTYLALMRRKTVDDLHRVIADVVSRSLSLGGGTIENLPLADSSTNDIALLEALDAKQLNTALRTAFDPEAYFSGVNRNVIEAAIAEMDPKQPIDAKAKKIDLVKLAVNLVTVSNAGGKPGYLPPEMRTMNYDGPRAAPVKAAAKPTAKAKPAKKVAKTAKKKAA